MFLAYLAKICLYCSPFGMGVKMIKRILSTVATVVLVLLLGAGLARWREMGISLASESEPTISFGEVCD